MALIILFLVLWRNHFFSHAGKNLPQRDLYVTDILRPGPNFQSSYTDDSRVLEPLAN